MIFHDVEQNSQEWFDLRIGKVTTSNFSKFMANYGKAFGDPALRYAHEIAFQQVTGEKIDDDSYSNAHMENGHAWEPVAKLEYEERTFYTVDNGGFCQHDKLKSVGGSPDGLMPNFKAGIEIKSVISWTQRNTIKRNSFDPAYRWQLLGNMWLCDLEWIDFVSYGFNYTDSKKLFIHKLERKDHEEQLAMIEPRLLDFLEVIEQEKKYL